MCGSFSTHIFFFETYQISWNFKFYQESLRSEPERCLETSAFSHGSRFPFSAVFFGTPLTHVAKCSHLTEISDLFISLSEKIKFKLVTMLRFQHVFFTRMLLKRNSWSD